MKYIGYILIVFILFQLLIPVEPTTNNLERLKFRVDSIHKVNNKIKNNIKVLKKSKDNSIINKISESNNLDTLKPVIIEQIKNRDQIIITQDSLITNMELLVTSQDSILIEQKEIYKKEIKNLKIGIVIIVIITTLILL